MILDERFTLRAPVEQVWAHLLDIPRVSRCIPGVQEVREIAPQIYAGSIQVKVGPMSAAFQGEVKILEQTRPSRIVAHITGDDRGSASTVGATFTVQLEPVETGTQVAFQVDYTLRGRLGSFGSAVLQGTVKKMTASFVECLQSALELEADESSFS